MSENSNERPSSNFAKTFRSALTKSGPEFGPAPIRIPEDASNRRIIAAYVAGHLFGRQVELIGQPGTPPDIQNDQPDLPE